MKSLYIRLLLVMFGALAFAGTAHAHGGVSAENDMCYLSIGAYKMHFAGYQPELSFGEEFCEDIPELGRALMVLDVIDAELREMKTGFRMVQYDTWPAAMKATFDDDAKKNALMEMKSKMYPKGSITIDYRFTIPGYYVGIVDVVTEEGDKIQSRFPFSVAKTVTAGTYRNAKYGAIVFLALLGFYFFMKSGKKDDAGTPPEQPA